MESLKNYFVNFWKGLWSLLVGMKVTGTEFVTPKVTEQYPENRETLKIGERFRATLTLKFDAEGNHKCIACGICQMNCPKSYDTDYFQEGRDGRGKNQTCTRRLCLRLG